jgi:hypothetical protein
LQCNTIFIAGEDENQKLGFTCSAVFIAGGVHEQGPNFEPFTTPSPQLEGAPTPTPVQTGVTILADGAVQTAQPALPVTFEIAGKLLAVHAAGRRCGEESGYPGGA